MIPPEVAQILKDYGIQTLMLVWFMFRMEKALDNNTKALLEMQRTVTLFFERKN